VTGRSASLTKGIGPEFAGNVLDARAYNKGIKLDFIRPGKPTENGYIKLFNSKLRDELLNTEIFSLDNAVSVVIDGDRGREDVMKQFQTSQGIHRLGLQGYK